MYKSLLVHDVNNANSVGLWRELLSTLLVVPTWDHVARGGTDGDRMSLFYPDSFFSNVTYLRSNIRHRSYGALGVEDVVKFACRHS